MNLIRVLKKNLLCFLDLFKCSFFSIFSRLLLYPSLKTLHSSNNIALILGNGPSLSSDKINRLISLYGNSVDIFASNRSYLFLDEWNISPFCYCVEDGLVINNFERELSQVSNSSHVIISSTKLGFRLLSKRWLSRRLTTFPFSMLYSYWKFPQFKSSFSGKYFFNGYTVTYFMLQLAVCLGYKQIFFLGVDNNYQLSDSALTTWSANDQSNPNHAHSSYLGDKQWNVPKPLMMNKAYEYSFHLLEQLNIHSLNYEPTSKLPLFKKTSLY